MNEEKLIIKIKGHSINVEAFGFTGETCEKVTESLDAMLNQVSREAKPERWEQDVQNIQQH